MNTEKIIRELVDLKAKQDNQIDLNAYENGMRAFAKKLSLYGVVGQSEQYFCCKEQIGQRCNEQCLGCFQFENKD